MPKILDTKQIDDEQLKKSFINKEIFALFFSVDLVNFTGIKQRSHFNFWTAITRTFYASFRDFCSRLNKDYFEENFRISNTQYINEFRGIQVWKVLGDEIILICLPQNIMEIPFILEKVYSQVRKFEKIIIPSEIQENKYVIENVNIRTKSTAWFIKSTPLGSATYYPSNVYNTHYVLHQVDITNIINYEFVGEHVDIGFRLSKNTVPNVLSISIELYYIIRQVHQVIGKLYPNIYSDSAEKIANALKLVGHSELKGVGNGSLYPILWYSNDWINVTSLQYQSGYTNNQFIKNVIHNNSGLIKKELDDNKFEIFTGVKQTKFYEILDEFYLPPKSVQKSSINKATPYGIIY